MPLSTKTLVIESRYRHFVDGLIVLNGVLYDHLEIPFCYDGKRDKLVSIAICSESFRQCLKEEVGDNYLYQIGRLISRHLNQK